MKKSDITFFQWMKKNTTKSPPRELDERILTLAHEKLGTSKSSSSKTKLILSGITVMASFALLLMLTSKNIKQKEISVYALSESPEMILNYSSIELMAEASALTDEDWHKIEGSR
ncbi:MAG: hypothetical protein ACXVKO_08520 [Bacteriovorax sp.]